MIKRKPYKFKVKLCSMCTSPAFSGGLCHYHDAMQNPTKYEIKGSRNTKSNKAKTYKPTGELALFKELYEERKRTCQITGQLLPFKVSSFAHILSKGAYPSFRLNPDNIIMVLPEIHTLYDNSSKEKLLEKYPEAEIIYELKDELRHSYYN